MGVLSGAPGVSGDPARGVCQRGYALGRLDERTRLAFTSVERIGADLRIVARVLPDGQQDPTGEG